LSRRRVALVVGQLHVGGAERQLFELATGLDRARFEPLVVCLSEVTEPYAGRLRALGVEVRVLPRAHSRDLSRALSLAWLLRRHRIGLAHSFLLAANAYTWAATRLAGAIPFIASSRTCIPPPDRWSWRVHRRAFRAARAVIVNARGVGEFTRLLYGLPETALRVIPNGVNLEPFVSDPSRRAALRAAWGVPDGAVLIGTLGRLSPEKNLPLFLRMAERLASGGAGAGWRCVVVGEGPARAELEDLSASLGLRSRVIFAGEHEEAAAALNAMDLFVMTSDTEGMPNAVLEAMAASLPVVATRVGGTPEIVEEGITGRLLPRRDAEAFSAEVARLVEDPQLRRRMGAAGRARVEGSFTVRAMVEATTRVYQETAP
jgi:glycosyltransferase involved in cell wall biosynthesis